MRILGTLPSLRASRNPIINLLLFLLVAYAAYKTAQIILADDLAMLAYVALFFCAGAVVIAVLNDWRRGLYILVGWILFEDFVRKYLGNNMAIYFAKDALALILYLSFFRARATQDGGAFSIPFRVPLLAFFWFAFLQVFNPASTSIFFGVLGMKIYFLYVPLIYVSYALIQSDEDLRRFLSYISVLILIVAGLGLAQSILGPTFLNPTDLQEEIRELSNTYRVAPISGLVAYRPTSVFVSAGRFQDFLILAWTISLGFVGYLLLRSRKGRTLAFTTIGVVAAASLMCASRGVLMWNGGITLVVAAAFLWGSSLKQAETVRMIRTIQRTALFIGAGIVLLLSFSPEKFNSRLAIYYETLMPTSSASDLVRRTHTYPLQELGYAFEYPRWPYGYGTGACSLGFQYVMRLMHVKGVGVGVESGFGNLVLEFGIVGLILWVILGISITFSTWKVVMKLRGAPWFPVSFVIFFYAFVLFFPMMYTGNSPYQDFLLNSYLWVLLGIVYRLKTLPKTIESS